MNTRFSLQARHQAAAFVLALASTLVIFSGVDRLSTPSQADAMLVKAQQTATRA